jgi:hypothetical protein
MAAIALAVWAQNYCQNSLSAPQWALLGLCTWSIYAFDHLQIHLKPAERHYFHRKNKKSFVFALILALVLALGFIPFVSRKLWLCGGIGSVLICVYLWFFSFKNQNEGTLKELLIAVLFAAGCFVGFWEKSFCPDGMAYGAAVVLVLSNLFFCKYLEENNSKKLLWFCYTAFVLHLLLAFWKIEFIYFALISGFYVLMPYFRGLSSDTKRIWADRCFLILWLTEVI